MTISPVTQSDRAAREEARWKALVEDEPASIAIRIGPMLMSIAAVPASTRCSAALRDVVDAEPEDAEDRDRDQVSTLR